MLANVPERRLHRARLVLFERRSWETRCDRRAVQPYKHWPITPPIIGHGDCGGVDAAFHISPLKRRAREAAVGWRDNRRPLAISKVRIQST